MTDKKLIIFLFLLSIPSLVMAQGGSVLRGAAKNVGEKAALNQGVSQLQRARGKELLKKQGVRAANRAEGSYLLTEYGQKQLHTNAVEIHFDKVYKTYKDQAVLSHVQKLTKFPLEFGQDFKKIYQARNAHNAVLFKMLQTANYEKFRELLPEIRAATQEEALLKRWVDFTRYIPEDRSMIFIRERPGSSVVFDTVNMILKNYRKKYPKRKIYLALQQVYKENLEQVILIFDGQSVTPIFEANPDYMPFLEQVWSKGVALEGLEYKKNVSADAARAFAKSSQVKDRSFSREVAYELSFYGIEARNKKWASALRRLRETAGPEAVIIVQGSNMIFSPQVPFNLPSLMKEEKGFYIDLTSLFASEEEVRWQTIMWNNLDISPAAEADAEQLLMEFGEETWILRSTKNAAHGKILGADMMIERPFYLPD